jgi:hypothetical protein
MATEVSPEHSGDFAEARRDQGYYYSPTAFFWAMFAVAWSTFRHPFSYTWIDLQTGEMQHDSREDQV